MASHSLGSSPSGRITAFRRLTPWPKLVFRLCFKVKPLAYFFLRTEDDLRPCNLSPNGIRWGGCVVVVLLFDRKCGDEIDNPLTEAKKKKTTKQREERGVGLECLN